MTVVPIVIGVVGSVAKGLEKGLEEFEIRSGNHPNDSIVKIGQNTEKISGGLEETCCHSNSSERPSADTGVKNFQRSKLIIMIIIIIIIIIII